MTDKELKDWCKTCNVEPPAMKFKCPECEHNPDKEQIIIDEVDVSGCILRRRKEANCTVCNGYSSKVFEFDCSDFKNCYFKQLARKTQECKRMRYYLSKIRQNELSSLDIEWDEYITECTCTDFSNIITYVEYALGERRDD